MIDADYRGPVMVLLYNLSDIDFAGQYCYFSGRSHAYSTPNSEQG